MAIQRTLSSAFFACLCVTYAWGQQAASPSAVPSPSVPPPSSAGTVSLSVPASTTLQVALDKEVRVKRVGQPIHARLIEPVYAFDEQLIPVGSEVLGHITQIEALPGKRRFLAALNADFTPTRRINLEFDEIVLSDGRHIPVKTGVTPGSGRAIQLVTTADKEQSKKKTAKGLAQEKTKEALAEAKRKWQEAMKQIKTPGRMHRLGRLVVAQLPVHPQYLDAGSVYLAELKDPLDFGSKPLSSQTLASFTAPPPPCNLLAHAQLLTPLSSATTRLGAPVEAVLTQPLFSDARLIFPQGSLLKGSVVQAQPARRLARHGKLRFVFHELVPPDGLQHQLDAYLEAVQSDQAQHVKLDTEGGAQPTSPKTRYLLTGLSIGLAVAAYQDSEADHVGASSPGNAGQGAAGGAAGFKLVGILAGAFIHSRPFALGMGVYGASRSVYSEFLARGREVTFQKGTAMEIGLWMERNCDASTPPK